MGDFVYNGEHSVDIILSDDKRINTWEKWRIAPAARPFVASPPIKEEYVDVPGADGMLDYTDILTGKVRYGNRTGSWQFLVENGNFEWYRLQSEILNTLHGKRVKVVLTDEPDYYYEGRITVGTAFGNKDYAGIIFNYNFGPYKKRVGSTSTMWWKWNELFMNTMLYGPFSVNGRKFRNFINEGNSDVTANFNVTYRMDLYAYDGSEEQQYRLSYDNLDNYDKQVLQTGNNDVVLHPGDNYFLFVGNGNVTVDYEGGDIL